MTRPNPSTHRAGITLAVALLGVGLLVAPGLAVADEQRPPSEGANFTVAPVDAGDRTPGATDAAYFLSSVGADAWGDRDGLAEIDYYTIRTGAVDFSGCDPDDIAALGIDRGGNRSGSQYDDDLVQHMKRYDITDERVSIEIYDEEDLGGDPTHLYADDRTVAQSYGCVSNPGEPGWYQFVGYVNGTGWDGEYAEVTLYSRYFWLCECEDETEARERLGPPPYEDEENAATSESTPTATPGTTETPTATPGTTETPTPTATATATATEAGDESETAEASTETPTATETPGDAGGAVSDDAATPTPGDGAGFGPVAVLLALLVASLLARRR